MRTTKFTFIIALIAISCSKEEPLSTDWIRHSEPVLRDPIPDVPYQVASDGHVFLDDDGTFRMIYSGDKDDKISIKLATGTSLTDWSVTGDLLTEPGPSGLDIYKETSFYRKADNGKHQIFYIGYDDEATYEASIYLAEADELEGPYTQMEAPIIPRGTIAGQEVYMMTSPTIMEHDDKLYMAFLGWDASPEEVTYVWILGAVSEDDGYTWTDFQEVTTPIGMEGQVTKAPDGTFYAVRTGDYDGNREAIYISHSTTPFSGWTEEETPIITRGGKPFEKDEVIAPQLYIDPSSGKKHLFYTGADHAKGWWIMLATEP